MSGSIASAFPTMNDLLAPQYLAERQRGTDIAAQTAGLAAQKQNYELELSDQAQIAQTAGYLLSVPEDKRAAAWEQIYPNLPDHVRARAPSTYQGHDWLQGVYQRAIPAVEQLKLGMVQPPGLAADLARAGIGAPGRTAGGLAGAESGGDPTVVNPGGYSGTYQFGKARLADLGMYKPAAGEDMSDNRNWAGQVSIAPYGVSDRAGFLASPGAQQAAMRASQANIDQAIAQTPGANRLDRDGLQAVAHLGGVAGMQKFVASGGAYDPADANGTHLSDYYKRFSGQRGVAARTGGTDVAGPGVGPAPAAAPAAPSPALPPGAPPDPNTVLSAAGSPPNALSAPPGAVPAPVPAPAAPAPGTALPAPGTGINAPQVQQANEKLRQAAYLETKYPASPQAKAAAELLKQQAALLMKLDTTDIDPRTGIQTSRLTGAQTSAAAPLANYQWDAQRGAYIDRSGTHPPVTPPSPRLTTTPGGDVIQSRSGGGAEVVYRTTPEQLAAQEAARAGGSEAGKSTAAALPKLAEQGRSAAAAISNIDYGVSQLDKAKAGGINTGYFSGALTGVQSALKSLGLPTDKIPFINVDPGAIGNIQTARKTLAVVSGAILQQIIGPNSQITDSKIEAFIHAQPGIETDPDAVRRVLGWARSQFTFEREMSSAAVKQAATTGMLPLNWQARYYDEHGFAPIYDPNSGEMAQPDGRSPPREPPAAPAAADGAPVSVKTPSEAQALKPGTHYSTPDGRRFVR